MNAPAQKADASAREFATRLRNTRERLGLTQSQLAERSGLTPAAISQVEGGQREPSFSTIVRLATALGTSPNDLMALESGTELDPSLGAFFRDLKTLTPDDYDKVRAFAQWLAGQVEKK